MDYSSILNLASSFNVSFSLNELLSKHTTFKIGGPADVFLSIGNLYSLGKIISEISKKEIPYLIMGNGSNLLIPDDGYRGVAIKLTGEFNKIYVCGNCKLYCGASAKLSQSCVEAQKAGLTGLEFAYGIPGTCGGAIYMNAGAYGGEISDVVISVSHVDKNGKLINLSKKELNFSYRKSIYGISKPGIITSMTLALSKGNREKIKEYMNELMKRRKFKQPLEMPSAGSVFKRPPGNYAGTLIEKCGLKGKKMGGAMVSDKHCGFIVNAGGATYYDVLSLIDHIKLEVLRQAGVELEEEINLGIPAKEIRLCPKNI
jgi:UDP-N-acetylmuramate dehydrogenase